MKEKTIFLTNSKRSCISSFLLLMKTIGRKPPHKFFLISEKGVLLQNLSLKDNILLDPMATHLAHNQDFLLLKYIKQSGNYYLIQLLKRLKNIHVTAKNASFQERLITILVKSLLVDFDYLLLNEIEKFTPPDILQLYKKALEHRMKANKNKQGHSKAREIYIHTKNYDFWKDDIGNIAHYDSIKGYQLSKIPKDLDEISIGRRNVSVTEQHEGDVELIELKRSA